MILPMTNDIVIGDKKIGKWVDVSKWEYDNTPEVNAHTRYGVAETSKGAVLGGEFKNEKEHYFLELVPQ